MEEENVEQEILLEPEYAVISPVTSVNGKIGDVVLTTSDLENDSDYQTGSQVQTAIATAIAGKQDTLTAGNGININAQNTISVDTTVIATQQNLANEVTNRENADNALQSQIDAISASSDVVDIVGTYAELQNYDTSGLGDNDIIKVLQDSTQNDATTYYRWSTTTQTFTLIGQEGPYYTKASADAQFVPQTRTVNGKALSANITLNASDVSALSPSDVDTQLANSTNPVQNKVLYGLLGDMPDDFFSGEASDTQTGTDITIGEAIGLTDLKMYGDTEQASYTGKNLFDKDTAPQGGYLANYSALSTGVRATATSTINYTYLRYVMNIENYVGQTLTLSATASASASNMPALAIGTCDSAGNNRVPKATQTGTGELTVSYTIESGDQYIYLNFYANQVGTAQVGDYTDYTDAQLELSATPTSYEPYTGGQPSPSPDYPQEIQTVTGEQMLTTRGKNLSPTFNSYTIGRSSTVTPVISGNEVEFTTTANGQGIFLAVAQNTPICPELYSEGYVCSITVQADKNAQIRIGSEQYTAETFSVGTTPTRISFLTQPNSAIIFYRSFTTGTATYTVSDIQVEIGSTASAYVPFVQPQSYTINLGTTELCKIGDYQDYIYKSGDDWYLHKETNKHTFTGSENWYLQTSGTPSILYCGSGVLSDAINSAVKTQIYSDYFHYTTGAEAGGCYLYNRSVFVFYGDTTTTASTFKTWLGDNNTTVYYPLATPTDTKITDQTLIDGLNSALNMTCYDGGTNIVVTSTNLPGELELTTANKTLGGIIALLRA